MSTLWLCGCAASSEFNDFVTTKSDKLMDGNKELRFVSYDIPNLAYVEDYMPFGASSPFRLPDEFEIRDALKAIKMAGGKVARIYTLSVRRVGESPNIIRHVEGPGRFDERAFRSLDKVLQVANEEGVRLIIPFVDNWWWWGGKAEYAAFRGKQPNDFWTDPQLISDFEKTISFVLNRKNTYTGVMYKDDKAVLGWETGNELEAPFSWQNTIAAYIKSIDKNHLVLEGTYVQVLSPQEVADSNFDVLSTHYYSPINQALHDVIANRDLTKGRKPYFVGEFGYRNPGEAMSLVDTVINSGVSGIMIWSMRFHAREGGFYQHGENYAVGSYRFPGFASGSIYNEKKIIDFLRQSAYAIDGLPEPPLQVPDPPVLLSINDVYDISWQGSTGASSYMVQRKELGAESWTTIADSASDAGQTFRPLYDDTSAELGKSYSYRVIAENSSGSSVPSNEVGPVEVTFKKLTDELADSSMMYQKSDSLQFVTYQFGYQAKNDFSRLRGSNDSYLIYHVPGNIDSIRVEVFQTSTQCGLDLSASDSLTTLRPLGAKLETFPPYRNFYRFFTPALYTCAEFPPNSSYLKIKFNDISQLSRVEIIYSKIHKPNPNIITIQ